MTVDNDYTTYPFRRNSFYELMKALSAPQKAVFLTGLKRCL